LILANNSLCGTIPKYFGKLNLQNWDISHNYFTCLEGSPNVTYACNISNNAWNCGSPCVWVPPSSLCGFSPCPL